MVKPSADGSQPSGGPLAGEPRERAVQGSARFLVLTWLAWWIVLMAFWAMLDDPTRIDEAVAGAVASALAALLATAVARQSGASARARLGGDKAAWLGQALTLPGQVARDTVVVFGALARLLLRGEVPASGYAEVPVRFGGDEPADTTRRVALTWAASLAPNSFAVDLDRERDVQVVHRLSGGDRP